jgi:hypothetical protein
MCVIHLHARHALERTPGRITNRHFERSEKKMFRTDRRSSTWFNRQWKRRRPLENCVGLKGKKINR